MDYRTRTTDAMGRRIEAKNKWNDSCTARAPSNRSPNQYKVQFDYGAMLLSAVTSCDIDEITRLLINGANVNFSNTDGLTSLHQACIDENLEIVKILINFNANVNASDNEGWTPLHAAASNSSLELLKYLVENGANVAAVNSEGELPLDLAEKEEIEKYLDNELELRGIDANDAREAERKTMLEDASKSCKTGEMNNICDPQGATPLHVAAAKGYFEVAKLLLSLGADPNAQDNDGWTPLHAAVHWKNLEICQELIANGANISVLNKNGENASHLADNEMKTALQDYSVKFRVSNKNPELLSEITNLFLSKYAYKKSNNLIGILKLPKCIEKANKKQSGPLIARPSSVTYNSSVKSLNIAKPPQPPTTSVQNRESTDDNIKKGIPLPSTLATLISSKNKSFVISKPPTISTTPKIVNIVKPDIKTVPLNRPVEEPTSTPTPPFSSSSSPSANIRKKDIAIFPIKPPNKPPKIIASKEVVNTDLETFKATIAKLENDNSDLQKRNLKLESENTEVKKERQSLLKIIDNLRENVKKLESKTKTEDKPLREIFKISRPPI